MAASIVYNPELGVIAATRFSAFLSQRDVGIRVPVNYVTHPGVVLAAACFANRTYEDAPAVKCISNLLASGFQRLDADVYWDASRSHWQLCPVELGVVPEPLTSSVSVASSPASASGSSSPVLLASSTDTTAVRKRQGNEQLSASTLLSTENISSIPSASRTISLSADATALATSVPTTLPDDDTSVIEVGPYYCSPTTDFDLLMNVIEGYLETTGTDLNATTLVLSLHVHAAAPASAPLSSPLQPANDLLPASGSLLSTRINNNGSAYLYTPTDLLSQRQSLNTSRSWFDVPDRDRPVSSFFQVDTTGGTTSTPDGWPSESYVEMSAVRRLMVQFGDIAPQMALYNFAGDASTIFPSNYLIGTPPVDAAADGAIISGCLFDPSVTTLSTLNSSWALNTIGAGAASSLADLPTRLSLGSNLTNCGFSPILNETLNSTTADIGYAAYQTFASAAAIWSWASGQPVNASGSDSNDNDRCAVLNATSGRWYATDCADSHYAACRVGNQPYVWQISATGEPYERVAQACAEDGTGFDAPRTALENAHLLSVWRQYLTNASRDDSDDDDDQSDPLLWLDFNQLDVSGCWVRGSNTTCPYTPFVPDETKRIAVPVVGAVIVFGVGFLTILVKCAGNRQTAKRRKRRREDGWDYEGVPS